MWLSGTRKQCVQGRIVSPGAVHVPESVIISILEHSLEVSICEVGGRVMRQVRGAFIVFLISAAWCILSAMEREYEFLVTLRTQLATSQREALRYVDNLLTVHRRIDGIYALAERWRCLWWWW